MRRTKILATLGPASDRVETIVRMIHAGLDAVRINFSHGGPQEHRALHAAARAAEAESGRPLPIMQDLQGTKIRVGSLEGGQVELQQGNHVRIDHDTGKGDAERFPVDDPLIVTGAKLEGQILLGDGDVLLCVERIHDDHIEARVESGGVVRQGAGITAPDVPLPGGLTKKDLKDLAHGAELGVDMVALSFVRNADEVRAARKELERLGMDALLVAKIERLQALEGLSDIMDAVDGILVARGDLGIALPPERVPVAQKTMLKQAAHRGTLSITATQMLESMVHSPRPTRAEASDVANAILDGTQVVMLSGETAIGDHPVEVVDMMARIVRETEAAVFTGHLETPIHRARSEGNERDAIALACAVTAEELDAAAIIAFTRTGQTALRVAKHRPRVRIIGATPDPSVFRKLNIMWGVTPIMVEETDSMRAVTREAARVAKAAGLVKKGDTIVLTGGDIGVPGSTNLMRVATIE